MIDTLNDLKQLVVKAAAEKKAFDILVLDLRERSDLTDFFVICSANSRMQVQAITDSILDQVYESSYKLFSTEGYNSGNWVVLDLFDVVVHVFHKDVRSQYDLERLWGDVPLVEVPHQ
ncbi:MAG: ribosome silencing factor [Nitrospina sp.]|jgi:ribosome-associated protein|nr:ribosome silencing factor [Nitrospina sp.]MBT6601525.1 ribosome silencing factor [Nitrospina sp.]